MTKRLVIYIDETWPTQPSAPWVLLDGRDTVLESGHSEPRHWPAAPGCEIVLGGPQCTWLTTTLPKSGRREQDRLLHYALEDKLIRDVESQHITVTAREAQHEGVRVTVLVTAKARLRTLLNQLDTIKRSPGRVIAELQSAAGASGRWTANLGPTGHWIVRPGAKPSLAADSDSIIDTLDHLLQTARGEGVEPNGLEVCCADGVTPPDLSALQAATGLSVTRGPRYGWWLTPHACDDLLHHEFEARSAGAGLRSALRAPIALAAAALGLYLLINVGEVLWQKQQLAAVEERMRGLFTTAVPNTPAIAPAQQLRRALDDLRSRHGQLRENDFLSLLDRTTATGGATLHHAITRLEYDNRSLEVTVADSAADALPLLAARLDALGLASRGGTATAPSLVIMPRSAP
jgi:general secretion pathway protein L